MYGPYIKALKNKITLAFKYICFVFMYVFKIRFKCDSQSLAKFLQIFVLGSARRRWDREERHVVELPNLGLGLVHLIPDAALSEGALLVLLALHGGISVVETFAPGAVVNPTKCVGGEAVHRLQAIDKLLLAGALEDGKPVSVGRQTVEYSMGLDNLVAVVVSPTALVRLPLPAKILKVGRRVSRSAPFGTGHRDACVGNWW